MRISVALTSASALLHTVSGYGPIVNVNTITSNSTDGVIECKSKVSIDCTFPTDDKIYSCIAAEEDGLFLQIMQKDCVNYGVNGTITATVTMSMCNENTESGYIFKPNSDKTRFMIASKEQTNFLDGYELNDDVKPGECKTMVQTHTMNTCEKPNNVPFSVKMEGNMNKALEVQKSYCYAYIHRKNRIKRFPDDILTNPTVFASSSQVVELPKPAPANCANKLSIKCDFVFKGETYSCVHPNVNSTDPIFVSEENECQNNSFQVTITMKMCNEESGGAITPYVKDEKLQPKFVFDGITRKLDNYLSPLEPKSCRIITFTETIDACRKTVPMSIRLYGKNTDGNDCMNYMFRKIFMEKIVRPPISEPSPTTVTNTSPVVAPKPSTETNPNPSPVVAPTVTKPDPSPVSTCNPDDAIITEVSVPQIDGSDLRYVEIFFKDCAGRRIKDDVKVGRGDNPTTDNVLDLIEFLVPTDGYVVICSDLSAVDAEYGAGTCDKQSPVANNEGYDPVAIVKGPFDANREILDIFGFPNDEDRETPDIKDGRAVRIKPNENSPTYVPEQWFIYPGVDGKNPVGPKGMDPGVWLMPIIITEIVDPDMGTNAADVNYAEAPRFIEMYVPNTDLHGKKIGDDLKLVLFRGDEEDPSFSPYVSLKDIDIPDNGVIVVCNQAGGAEWGTNKCDIIKTDLFDLRGGYFGCDRAAIVHGNNKDSYSIIDMYGLIGVDCAETMHDFIDGRGVRLSNSTIPEPIWNIFNWEVISGVSPDECKPGSWPEQADPKPDENAPPSPANTPPPAPTKGGKGDKSDKGDKKGKSPGLRRRRRRAALL